MRYAGYASFVVIARDITSEKQMESRMSETEKLAGIGQLAAGIAHQLNTPVTVSTRNKKNVTPPIHQV